MAYLQTRRPPYLVPFPFLAHGVVYRSEQELEGVRMDLDSYLQSEMEDLNDMFQEFETQDQRKKIRDRDEEEKIMTKVSER